MSGHSNAASSNRAAAALTFHAACRFDACHCGWSDKWLLHAACRQAARRSARNRLPHLGTCGRGCSENSVQGSRLALHELDKFGF